MSVDYFRVCRILESRFLRAVPICVERWWHFSQPSLGTSFTRSGYAVYHKITGTCTGVIVGAALLKQVEMNMHQ